MQDAVIVVARGSAETKYSCMYPGDNVTETKASSLDRQQSDQVS